jgi:hypothetical protein
MKYGIVLYSPKSEMFTLIAEGTEDEMTYLLNDRLIEHFGPSSNKRSIVPETQYPQFGYEGYTARTPHLDYLR